LPPSKENRGAFGACARIDETTQARTGIAQCCDLWTELDPSNTNSLARLAGHLQPASTQVNVALQTNINVGAAQIAARLIQEFDHQPEIKAQIAHALLEVDHEHSS
jgi:hypothetical protein